MKDASLASKPEAPVCPLCEEGRLRPTGHGAAWCPACVGLVGKATVETLRQIAALPDALGSHACECGHPEMRLLPDRTYHCPACRSEVLPLGAPGERRFEHRGEAYRCGWFDGRYGKTGCFTENASLTRWENPSERLDYYRGHRAGSQARRTASASPSKAHGNADTMRGGAP